jgi:hypothetical protein
MTKSNPKKYANRMLAHYIIILHHRSPDTDMFRKMDKWINLGIILYTTDDTGNMLGKHETRQCNISWTDSDFAISKLSVKLLEKFLQPLVDNLVNCASITGLTLDYIIKHYKKHGKVNFDDTLQPLKKLL